jgi:triosephosphate isomerase
VARVPVVAANWKMYKTPVQARDFVTAFKGENCLGLGVDVIICPSPLSVATAGEAIAGAPLGLGGQNMYTENEGAFTGEVSPVQLKAAGCKYVIIGHSERRKIFGETDALLNRKLKACVREGLTPIFCVGETLEERDGGKTQAVVGDQLAKGLDGIPAETVAKFIIAYEPVWAIGTGRNATPEQAQEVHAFIRGFLKKLGAGADGSVPVLYGGSVKPDNTPVLMKCPDVDGALVGGASLDPKSFAAIVRGTAEAKKK